MNKDRPRTSHRRTSQQAKIKQKETKTQEKTWMKIQAQTGELEQYEHFRTLVFKK